MNAGIERWRKDHLVRILFGLIYTATKIKAVLEESMGEADRRLLSQLSS